MGELVNQLQMIFVELFETVVLLLSGDSLIGLILLTLFLSSYALYVAFRARLTSERRAREALFESRFLIYETVHDFLESWVRTNEPDALSVQKLSYAQRKAQFLFHKKVPSYLGSLLADARQAREQLKEHETLHRTNPEKAELISKEIDSLLDRHRDFKELEKAFTQEMKTRF